VSLKKRWLRVKAVNGNHRFSGAYFQHSAFTLAIPLI
jgi:hypothetical protein